MEKKMEADSQTNNTTLNQNKTLNCEFCEETFQLQELLDLHYQRSHRSVAKLYQCSHCGKNFQRQYFLTHLAAVHYKVKNFPCKLCDFKSFTHHGLLNHTRDVHEKFRMECTVCQKLVTVKNMPSHIRIHTGEKPYKCSLCDKRFRCNVLLAQHINHHKERNEFLCEFCGKIMKSQNSFKAHQNYHHKEEKIFSCDFCSKTFQRRHHLDIHLLVHTKEKSFICTLCDKTFTRKWNLTLHLRIHNNEKPHACTICEKAFANPSNLTTHMRSHRRKRC